METSHVGAIILRVQGDAAGPNDLRVLMKEIVRNAGLRVRCKSIGYLTRDIPKEDRRDYCKMCLDILYSWAPPPELYTVQHAAKLDHFLQRPMLKSAWSRHVWKDGGKDFVSGLLMDVLTALEALWNVPGHLVKTA